MLFSSQIQNTAAYQVLGRKLTLPPPEPVEECMSQDNTPTSPCLLPALGVIGLSGRSRAAQKAPSAAPGTQEAVGFFFPSAQLGQHQVRVLLCVPGEQSWGPGVISVLAFFLSHSPLLSEPSSSPRHLILGCLSRVFCFASFIQPTPAPYLRCPWDIPAHQWGMMWTHRTKLPRASPCCLISPHRRVGSSHLLLPWLG